MFLGALSNQSEQQATKKKKKKSKSGSKAGAESQDESLKLKPAGEMPITYTAEGNTIPRDYLMSFLETCKRMMLDSHNLDIIIDHSLASNGKSPLHMSAMEFQRDVLEFNFGIERNFGCKYMSDIPKNFPTDVEMQDAAKSFMFTAMRSYINVLRRRKERYDEDPSIAPDGRQFGRSDMLEFFEGCNALMTMPETKQELIEDFKRNNKPPGPKIIELQRSILVTMGFNADKAIERLNNVQQEFGNDKEVITKMSYFGSCAQVAMQEAVMSEAERKHFYSQIPSMMQHFPHIYVMQQRHQQMQMQQQQMQMQQQMQGGGAGGAGGAAGMMPPGSNAAALKESGVLDLLMKPDGRAAVSQLGARVQAAKAKMEDEVLLWDSEKKTSFFNSFAEHPIVHELQSSSEDPLGSIMKFISMSESDLNTLMTFMLVSASDGGKLIREFNSSSSSAAPSADAATSPSTGDDAPSASTGVPSENALIINRIIATMGSLINVKYSPPPVPGQHDHDHSHSHDHQHGPNCSHGHAVGPPKAPDVSTGKSTTMER